MHVLEVAWRIVNVGLATAGLVLLVDDIRRRRRLQLRQRFYWQAVALLLITTGWGTIAAIVEDRPVSPPVTAVATLAVTYFLISIVQVRRFNRREEREMGVPYGDHS